MNVFQFNTFKHRNIKIVFACLVILSLCLQVTAQTVNSLPRSTPEEQGVSSAGIIKFLEAANSSKHEFHSIMMLRHGMVVAEGWWSPYRADLKHTLYSTSKSFTATAVGFAVTENKLSVDDKVISFFPDQLPETVSDNLAELRVKDLLSMSVGHQADPTWPVASTDNWVKAFLATPIVHKPGTKFLYNSVASHTLSAIVQKVTGQKIADYLQPRLFEPLGIEGVDWETDPQGNNTGGWGLRLKTEDMAKFGQLFLQKGKWRGRQILPSSWVEEATSMKIEQDPDAPQDRKDTSDWLQGYCYQMWRSRHNAYRGDGAYGQFIIVMPEKDAVVAITAETPDMQSEINLVWEYLLPAIKSDPLPAAPGALARLKDKLATLALPVGEYKNPVMELKPAGKRYVFEDNDKELKGLGFEFRNGVCRLSLETVSARYNIDFGAGKRVEGQTKRYGPYLVGAMRHNRVGLPPFKVAGSYSWPDEKTLELTLRYIESPHTETIRCNFEDRDVLVEFKNSFNNSVITCKGSCQ